MLQSPQFLFINTGFQQIYSFHEFMEFQIHGAAKFKISNIHSTFWQMKSLMKASRSRLKIIFKCGGRLSIRPTNDSMNVSFDARGIGNWSGLLSLGPSGRLLDKACLALSRTLPHPRLRLKPLRCFLFICLARFSFHFVFKPQKSHSKSLPEWWNFMWDFR